MTSRKTHGLTLLSDKLRVSSRYYVSVTKAWSWLEIGVSLCKPLQMAFYNIIFQRELILEHQNFNFWQFLILLWKLYYTCIGFAKRKTSKDRVNHLDMKLPTYLVIHTCTLSFFHHLIQKLPIILILDSLFLPQDRRSPHVPKELAITLHCLFAVCLLIFLPKSQWLTISYLLWASNIIFKVFQGERFIYFYHWSFLYKVWLGRSFAVL